MEKIQGTVKTFNSTKGYGFIVGNDGNSYFFHYSSLNVEGYKTIKVGAKVSFSKNSTEKGLRAEDISIVL